MPGYLTIPEYSAQNISVTPAGDLAANNIQSALEELDSDLSGGLASKLPYSYGTATPSTTDSGYLWYDSNSTPAAPKFWDGAAFQALGGAGKILQIAHGITSTVTANNTGSFVNTALSANIIPISSTSTMLIFARFGLGLQGSQTAANMTISARVGYSISGGASGELPSFCELAYDNRFSGPQLFGQELIPSSLIDYHSHATSNSITYTVQIKGTTNSGVTHVFGRYNSEGNSTIMIIEVDL